MKARYLPLMLVAVGLGCQQPPSLSGTYGGKLQSSSGEVTVQLTLTEVRKALSGSAQPTGSALGFRPQRYYVVGSHLDDGTVELDISLNTQSGRESLVVGGACAYRLIGPADRAGMAGTYSTHICQGGSTGTFELNRQ